MNIKIIEFDKEKILWDCFRNSYICVLNSEPLLIECKINSIFNGDNFLIDSLICKVYKTNNSNTPFRIVEDKVIFQCIHNVHNRISDSIIIEKIKDTLKIYKNH